MFEFHSKGVQSSEVMMTPRQEATLGRHFLGFLLNNRIYFSEDEGGDGFVSWCHVFLFIWLPLFLVE